MSRPQPHLAWRALRADPVAGGAPDAEAAAGQRAPAAAAHAAQARRVVGAHAVGAARGGQVVVLPSPQAGGQHLEHQLGLVQALQREVG